MNEAEKVFYDDVREKKQIAQNAFKKKGGLNTVKAPFNNYTKPQADKKNGDISTFNLNRPMDWKTFKSMPIDLQRKYLLILQENGANLRMMANMMGVTADCLAKHRRNAGLNITSKKSWPGEPEKFEAWKKGDSEEPEESPLPVVEEEEDTQNPYSPSARITMECTALELKNVIDMIDSITNGERMCFVISYQEPLAKTYRTFEEAEYET